LIPCWRIESRKGDGRIGDGLENRFLGSLATNNDTCRNDQCSPQFESAGWQFQDSATALSDLVDGHLQIAAGKLGG
jgi:hypothetical protein